MRLWKWQLDDNEIEFEDREAVNQTDGELNDTIVTYEGNTSDVQSWTDFIGSFVNGMKIGKFFKNLYAGIQYVLHVGSLVNNCVTDNSDLPLSAAQGKVLMDEITQLNSALTGALTVTEAEFTPNDYTFTRNYIYKFGSTCIFLAQISPFGATSEVNVATIPSGFRPIDVIYFPVAYSGLSSHSANMYAYVMGSSLYVRCDGASQVLVSGAYISTT